MRDVAIHESGAVIDLAEPSRHDEVLLRSILAARSVGRPLRKGALRCATHQAPMYLKVYMGAVYACHWPNSGLSPHQVALMSTEHRMQAEYVGRAGDRAGLDVAFEMSLPTHVRPDVVIGGTTAVEVQRSKLSVGNARNRTAKAIKGGMAVSLWLSDKEPRHAPQWLYRVPSATAFARDWNVMPPLGSATVTSGLRELVWQPCRPPYRTTCPVTRRAWCGKQHLAHEPMRGVSLDALAVGVATGEYVPAQVGNHVLLVREQDARRYDVSWAPPTQDKRPDLQADRERVECQAPMPVVPGSSRRPGSPREMTNKPCVGTDVPCPRPGRLYPGGWRCDEHSPAAMRRALEARQ